MGVITELQMAEIFPLRNDSIDLCYEARDHYADLALGDEKHCREVNDERYLLGQALTPNICTL